MSEPKELAKALPKDPGVYLMKNESGVIIYIGKAKNLKNRVTSYFVKQKNRPTRLKHLIQQIVDIDYMITGTEVEAFLLEASLIKKHRPRYNIRLKDDKAYPYIKCSLSEKYPKFTLARKVQSGKDVFYGPFTSGYLVRETIRFINGFYMIRDCANGFMRARKRPCLSYEIKRCTAPCVEYVTQDEYRDQIDKALYFLNGESKDIVDKLNELMLEASEREEYEKAAEHRDQINAVKLILEKQRVVSTEKVDQDIVACIGEERGSLISMIHVRQGRVLGQKFHFLSRLQTGAEDLSLREKLISFLNQYYLDNFIPDSIYVGLELGRDLTRVFSDVVKERRGEDVLVTNVVQGQEKHLLDLAEKNAKEHFDSFLGKSERRATALQEIMVKLKLPELPERMECFDISNFQGDQSVGSQVVFQGGLPSPEDYRRYKIKTVVGPDDFMSMKEVLSRRLKHTEYQDPQLILIDGGKGQLKMAYEALKELGRDDIPVVGLAKSRSKGDFGDSEVTRTQERFFLVGRQNPITFQNQSEALKILTHLRDEAHRFAITFHRSLREAKSLESIFSGIPGLGPKGQAKLEEFLRKKDDWDNLDYDDLKSQVGVSSQVLDSIKSRILSLTT